MNQKNNDMKGQSIIYFKAKNIKDEATIKSIEFEIFSILDEEDDKLIAVEDFGDFDVIYSFLPEYKTHKFMNILEKFGVLIESGDITEDVLMARKIGKEFTKTFEDQSFREILERFIEKNLTIDLILDKINEQGIGSLNEIDKKILEDI
jgi:hypothetical protein